MFLLVVGCSRLTKTRALLFLAWTAQLTDFSGIETAHCYALAALKPSGEASLQIALAEACSSLRLAPSYATREILIVHSTITTCDPSDVFSTIAAAKKLRIRCSVISISSEVYIFRHVTEETNGDFHVCQGATGRFVVVRFHGAALCVLPVTGACGYLPNSMYWMQTSLRHYDATLPHWKRWMMVSASRMQLLCRWVSQHRRWMPIHHCASRPKPLSVKVMTARDARPRFVARFAVRSKNQSSACMGERRDASFIIQFFPRAQTNTDGAHLVVVNLARTARSDLLLVGWWMGSWYRLTIRSGSRLQ